MALGGVFMSDTDGNIGTSSTTSTEMKKVLVWP